MHNHDGTGEWETAENTRGTRKLGVLCLKQEHQEVHPAASSCDNRSSADVMPQTYQVVPTALHCSLQRVLKATPMLLMATDG